MPIKRDTPYVDYLFRLEIADQEQVDFSEVSGVSLERDVIEYWSSARKLPVKMPGRSHASDVTLKRGVTGSIELYSWYQEVLLGEDFRRDVTLSLLNEKDEAVFVWRLHNAWPRKYVGPILNARGGNDVAIEELVIVSEDIRVL
ncbi:phage tail protein [Gymnodinialimonas sp.]